MSETMTIDQVRKERRLLAEQIQHQVKAFSDKTGVSVEYITLNYADITTMSGESGKILISVEVDLNI